MGLVSVVEFFFLCYNDYIIGKVVLMLLNEIFDLVEFCCQVKYWVFECWCFGFLFKDIVCAVWTAVEKSGD